MTSPQVRPMMMPVSVFPAGMRLRHRLVGTLLVTALARPQHAGGSIVLERFGMNSVLMAAFPCLTCGCWLPFSVPAGMSVVPPTMSPGQMHGGTTRHFPSGASLMWPCLCVRLDKRGTHSGMQT